MPEPRTCPTCGQPLPEQARRDPPLPQLEQPDIVTIHDLADPAKAAVDKIRCPGENGAKGYTLYRLKGSPGG